MRDLFGTRLELRLGDPMDSEIDRKIAALVPAGRSGSRPGAEQAALPRGAAPHRRSDRRREPRRRGRRPDQADRGRVGGTRPAPSCDCCPSGSTWPPYASSRPADDRRLLVGVNEKDLGAVGLDVDAEPHLLVFGDGQSGKSAVLRAYAQEIMRTRSPKEAQLVVVDYRRSLLGEIPDDYLLNYLTSSTQAQPALRDLASYLEGRIPGPDVTPEQLRNRTLVDRRRGVRADRRLRPGRDPAELARAGAGTRCSPRPATSVSTSSSRAAPAVRRGRSTSRSSSPCATWRCRACCSPAARTRVR